MNSFTDSASNVFVQGVATSISYSIAINNVATAATDSGNDIIAATGSDANYDVKLQFSDVDLGAGGSDGLSHTPDTITLSTADSQQSLAAGSSFTLSGTHSITLDPAKCAGALFFCAVLLVPSTATYADAGPTNNVNCMSITTRKTCVPGKFIL